MGNLTRAAYANQRMTLFTEIAKFHCRAEYDVRATLVINVACFIIMLGKGRLAMPCEEYDE